MDTVSWDGTDVALTSRGAVAALELNRPARLNAIRPRTLEELATALTEVERTPEVAVLIISGAGRAFCAGADIAEIDNQDQSDSDAFTREGQALFDRLAASPVISIAAVHGYALGGGLELAMACDLRIAAASAQVGQPEATLGHLPAWGGTQRLPRLVGRAAALQLMLTGQRVPAAEALRLGLVDEVVADDRLAGVVRERAAVLAGAAPTVVRVVKAAVDAGERSGLAAGFQAERLGMALCRGLPESSRRRSEFLTHNEA